MKLKIVFISIFLALFGIVFTNKISAATVSPFEYNVNIKIEEDSTFTVREEISNKINGDFHGLRRDIPLQNENDCANLVCGGFELIIPLAIYDEDGKEPETGSTKFYTVQDEPTGINYQRFEWELYSDGKDVTNEELTWIVEYKIIGGIAWLENRNSSDAAVFYWNILGLSLGDFIEDSKMTIEFPDSVKPNLDNLRNYTSLDAKTTLDLTKNRIVIEDQNIPGSTDYTISYEFEEDELTKPGVLSYNVKSPIFGTKLFIDDNEVYGAANSDEIKYFPEGKHEIRFERFGYQSQTKNIEIESGKEESLVIELKPNTFTSLLLSLGYLSMLGGIALIPVAIIYVANRAKQKGSDVNEIPTVIPLFSPPKNVRPYLLGSLKDESVDKEDITGTIIDLAYRGYIKIKEIKEGKNYELTRIVETKKEDEGLDETEKDLMNAIFKKGDKVETKNFDSTFVLKLQTIQNSIYDVMVDKGYFDKSPKTTRNTYVGMGCLAAIFGMSLLIGLSILLSLVLGKVIFFTIGIALIIYGLGTLLTAKQMPSKTALGSKVLNEILGFKMYLNTAERFRLQKLGPDEFERYLSYAIVFKIEKEWAEKFKDIYNKVPDWYEGSGNINNAMFYSNFARGFSNSTVSKINTVSSSSRGGGWSSGGSFSGGGFSGGGGGGGSSGGW